MLNFYKKLFFKFYALNLKSWKDSSPAAAQAFAAVLMYMFFNVYSLLQLSDTIIGTKLLTQLFQINVSGLTYLGVVAVVVGALWFSFIFNGKYKHVIEECEGLKQTTEQKRSWEILLRSYEIGSIVLLILSVVASPIAAR
jgi:hypothetical protein